MRSHSYWVVQRQKITEVYPNGENERLKEYVSIYLVLLKPNKAKAKYTISILNDKEEEKNIWNSIGTREFDRNDKNFIWGYRKFVKKDLLLEKSNCLLINDTLTILCKAEIFELESENHGNRILYDVLYTNQTDVNNFKYEYTIQNFSLRPEKTGEKIISPTFVVGSKERSEWCLHICPNGQDEDSKEYISVYLTLLKPDKAKAKYRFSILNYKKEEENVKFVTESEDFIKDIGLEFSQFVKKDFLVNKLNGLLVNDCLVIFCEVDIIDLKTKNHGNLEIVDSKTLNNNNLKVVDSRTENYDNPETSTIVAEPQSELSKLVSYIIMGLKRFGNFQEFN
uniref:Speckle-type POZ protein-like (inferred by orthology to a human protein) n=1 Tax=Strongyloides venezuelensis TaxID=75913 RepID=A0A0K0EZZ2_STRVS